MKVVFFAKSRPSDTPSTRYRCRFLTRELERRNIQCETIFPYPLSTSNRLLDKFYRGLIGAGRVVDLIGAGVPDLLFVQGTPYRVETVPLLKAFRKTYDVPMIFNFDDANYLHRPWICRTLTRSADRVLVPSQRLLEYVRCYHDRVDRFPLGVDTDRFTPPEGSTSGTKPSLIWFGNTRSHWRNLEFLAEVFHDFENWGDFRLTIAGEKHPDLVDLWSFLGDQCDLTGYLSQPELIQHLQGSDCGLVPIGDNLWANSKFPVKAVEMMASGVPVVASQNSELRHVLSGEECGFLRPNQPERWADLLGTLCRDPDLLHDRGRRSRELMVRDYSIKKTAQQAETIFHELVS